MHNELHDRLIAEGYTKDNHPPYARWAYGWECFEYTLETVAGMVWETPCGLLRQGKKQGEPASDFLRKWSKEQLEKRGIITAEQISIFDFGGEM